MTWSVLPARRRAKAGLLVAVLWLEIACLAAAHAAPVGSDPWTERAVLAADDGAINDYLGRSVAIDGDVAVIGAAGADVTPDGNEGAAYVFVRIGDAWVQQAKLTAPDGVPGDEFGFAVAIDGDTIVVGARFAPIDAVDGRGAMYVFVRSGEEWVQQAKLVADDGAAYDELGFSVTIDGDTAAVGAPFANSSRGKVYVFARDGSDWSAQATLAADDAADFDRFGLALSVKSDTLLVGSPSADVAGNTDQGTVYVYDRSGATWVFSDKLAADDGAPFDELGNSVSLDGDTAVVGAHYANVGANQNQGAAYAFARDGGVWTQQAKLAGDHSSYTDEFGISVSLSGGVAVVGALFANPNDSDNQGEAYVFASAGGAWSQQAYLASNEGHPGDELGIGVGVDGDTAVVGADFGLVDDEWRGAAYVFSSRGPAHANVAPTRLDFALAAGESASSPVAIANDGGAGSVLDVSIEESDADCSAPSDVSWLSIDASGGSVVAGSPLSVNVTADADGLPAGDYSALVCIETSDATQPTIGVDVFMTVSDDVLFADGFDDEPTRP